MKSHVSAIAIASALAFPAYAQVSATPGEEMTCGEFAALSAGEQEATLRALESTSADAGSATGTNATADTGGAAGAMTDTGGGTTGVDATGDTAGGAGTADVGGGAGADADADAVGMDVAAVLEACAADPAMPVIEAMRSPM